MADKKAKRPEFNTPKATFSYPKLLVPDTKFNANGVLSVKLILPEAAAEEIRRNAGPIMVNFIAADIAATEEAAKKNPKIKKTLEAKKKADGFNMSIEDQLDEKGDATGNKLVRFKQTATFKVKNSKGVETQETAVIPLFDAKGQKIATHDKFKNLLPDAIRIYGGSEGKVRYVVIPAFIQSSGTYHASLRPIAVQITKLVSGTAGRDAAGFGFEAEEDGFSADQPDSTAAPTEGTDIGDGTSY